MESKNNLDIVLLSSSYFNNKEILNQNKSKIITFISSHTLEESIITIGNIKNAELINFLKENKFNVEVKRQTPSSLVPSNRKSIKESKKVLFLYYSSSKNLSKFIEYAKNLDDKEFYILDLS